MSILCLNQHVVDNLRPGAKTRHFRDADFTGFGVRVLPTGRKRYFVHSQRHGRRVWRCIGDAGKITYLQALSQALAVLEAVRNGEAADFPWREDTVFEAVATEVFRRYGRNWKPRTLQVNRCYLENQILPWFRGRQIADIGRRDVQQWFASLQATPASADRSAPVLSVIMKQAETYGYRPEGSNPCTGIRRYRRGGRERFLSQEEIRRLGTVLASRESCKPLHSAVVRLLLLTGCRKTEILTLKWVDFREGNLFLADSKTGPRTVWLSTHARTILDGIPRISQWVFPGQRARGPISDIFAFWRGVREEAGLDDVRLHDLRHTYASIAIRAGETVRIIGNLLGHNDPATTLKYVHIADEAVRKAAATVATAMRRAEC